MAKQPDSPPLAAMVPSALAPPGQSMPGLWLSCVALLLIALGSVGAQAQAPAGPPPLAPAGAPPAKPWDAVLIASFNIQVFGESKIAKPQVVNVLTQVVRVSHSSLTCRTTI